MPTLGPKADSSPICQPLGGGHKDAIKVSASEV